MELPFLGIVGGDSLLGQEIKRRVDNDLPGCIAESYGANLGGLSLETDGEEAAIMAPLSVETMEELDLAFLAGPADSSLRVLEAVHAMKPRPALIDVTGALDDHPESRLRSPLLAADAAAFPGATIETVAHPASTALALLLAGCARAASVRSSVAQIFEPVSERGQAGVAELQRQTVALLSFKPVPTEIFDTQVSFNLLPRYGPKAARSLADVEARVEKHLASLLGRATPVPLPSLRVLHTPVFHNYTFSVWVEFGTRPPVADLAAALEGRWVKIQPAEEEPATNTTISGESGVTIVSIDQDRNNAHAVWVWMVADNLRLAAETAVWTAKSVLYPAPEGGKL